MTGSRARASCGFAVREVSPGADAQRLAVTQTLLMKVSFGVAWKEGTIEVDGLLLVESNALRLLSHDPGKGVLRELPLDEVVSLELVRPEDNGGRAAVSVACRDGGRVVIESAVGRWIYGDLVERMHEHALGHEDEPHVGLGL